jgi:hypothetical protein
MIYYGIGTGTCLTTYHIFLIYCHKNVQVESGRICNKLASRIRIHNRFTDLQEIFTDPKLDWPFLLYIRVYRMLQEEPDPILGGMYTITYRYRMRTVFENQNSVAGRRETNKTRSHHLTSMPCTRNTHNETVLKHTSNDYLTPCRSNFYLRIQLPLFAAKNETLVRKRSMQ